MKIGVAISLSLLGHGIVLMPWPGTTDLSVNSTPSSFQVTLQQDHAIQTPDSPNEIKRSKSTKKIQVEKTEHGHQEVHKKRQAEQTETSNTRLNTETRAYVIKRLTAAMENHFSYPLLARRNGWQGKVLLGLYVDAKGSIENVHIKTGSGYNILDQSALNALLKVRHIKNTAHWLNIHNQEIIIPVIYRLQEG